MEKTIIGWKEWCSLPLLNLNNVEAKVDTGAATSALHADILDVYEKESVKYVKFKVYNGIVCESKIIDYKYIMSSNGIKEKRYVIKTLLMVGTRRFYTQITLSDRSPLRYAMLLGRLALRKKFLIDPSLSNVQGFPYENSNFSKKS